MLYLWLKVFHIFAFVAWFAGIFYIWRLFVYHTEASSQEVKETLKVMERKLYTIIMRPAMVVTLACGSGLFALQWHAYSRRYWIWLKLLLVLLVLAQHFLANYYRQQLEKAKQYPSKKFRMLNELPTLLLLFIISLVVLKPF